MSKRKVRYCYKCHKDTVQEFINKETVADDGAPRIILGIISFGLSEFAGAKKYWQCTECGNIDSTML